MDNLKRSFEKHKGISNISGTLLVIAVLIGLYMTTAVNYLLFHLLVELFSIIVAFTLSIITWNSRGYIKNQFFLLIGIAYLFVGFIDLLHTLSYVGMNIFPDDRFYANQLWIGGRYLESLTLLVALIWFRERVKNSEYLIAGIYTLITTVLVYSIFVSRTFPACYILNQGQTPFKIVSEYIIMGILLFGIVVLYKRKEKLDRTVYFYIGISMVLTILSEFAFTQYVSNYGVFNLIGHYLKLFSYFFIYKSIIETSITRPFRLIFREIDELNSRLNRELELKTEKEKENEKLIQELKEALEEVKILGDLLPVCMHCRKVRDDSGYWSQIEEYIAQKTGTDFSHGICPECLEKYYPDLKEKMDQKEQD